METRNLLVQLLVLGRSLAPALQLALLQIRRLSLKGPEDEIVHDGNTIEPSIFTNPGGRLTQARTPMRRLGDFGYLDEPFHPMTKLGQREPEVVRDRGQRDPHDLPDFAVAQTVEARE